MAVLLFFICCLMRLLFIICFSVFTLSSHAQDPALPSWMLHALGVHGDLGKEAAADSALYQLQGPLHPERNRFIGTYAIRAKYWEYEPTTWKIEGWSSSTQSVITIHRPGLNSLFFLADRRAGVVLTLDSDTPDTYVNIEHLVELTEWVKGGVEIYRARYTPIDEIPAALTRTLSGHPCSPMRFSTDRDTITCWSYEHVPSPFSDIRGWLKFMPELLLQLSMMDGHTTLQVESKRHTVTVTAIKPGNFSRPRADLSSYDIYDPDLMRGWERSATADGLVPYGASIIAEEATQFTRPPDPLSIDDRFLGGQQAMDEYIQKAIQYPPAARKAGIHGRVYVRCLVHPLGLIQSAEIDRGVSPELDAEALRVVKTIPRLEPVMGYGDDGVMVLIVNFELP